MGMYTEFHFNSELIMPLPNNIKDILLYMIGDIEDKPNIPNHNLFKTDRWRFMLQSDSHYFDADTYSTLRYDKISRCYYLCIRCNLKNYCSEIELFIDWISQYLNKFNGDFLGFYRYEETETPTIIYYRSN